MQTSSRVRTPKDQPQFFVMVPEQEWHEVRHDLRWIFRIAAALAALTIPVVGLGYWAVQRSVETVLIKHGVIQYHAERLEQ